MTAILPVRFRNWLLQTFTYNTETCAAGAMADASRWGWLPALSGVAMGADLARAKYAETLPEGTGLSD
ncbi:MAG: hypothetical protein HOQ06_08335 [Pseudarthrobacter sp.]|nr:hypothetical protein [Pseudarthrobacter sp.]